MKVNVKILPDEKTAIQKVVALSKLKNVTRLICIAVGHPACRAQIQDAIEREMPFVAEGVTRPPTKRLQISVRFGKPEIAMLKDERARNETRSDEIRRLLGLRPISFWFRPAALASSRRAPGPIVTDEMVAAYYRLAAALIPDCGKVGGSNDN